MTRRKTQPSKAPSINDVARLSGVSVTTVSRVINKFPTVKERSRQRVLQAIKELNFQPSVYAQRLASGKSNVVALVVPRYEGIFYSFYALELIRGVGALCETLKLDLLLHLTDMRTPLNLKGVGGIIFTDMIGNRHQLEDTLSAGTPCVVMNNFIEDLAVTCITIDNQGGAESAVAYLINLGHRRIAHITGALATQSAAQRLQGYKLAMAAAGIEVNPDYIFQTDYSRGQARQAAENILRMKPCPTAVFVASDSMALEVMAVAKETGREIPRDLSIVGFDDNPSGLYGPVALTTVRQPLAKMAEEGIKDLNLLMTGKDNVKIRKIALPTELIIRESCRAIGP